MSIAALVLALLAATNPHEAGTETASPESGVNLALGRPYTLWPRPSYRDCTDPGDETQLTDGKFAEGYFWTQKETVGWQSVSAARIVIDLGEPRPIEAVTFSTAAGVASVSFPQALDVYLGNDEDTLVPAGDARAGAPIGEGYERKKFVLSGIGYEARYVAVLAQPSGRYLFCDEIEVMQADGARPISELAAEPVSLDGMLERLENLRLLRALKQGLQVRLEEVREAVGPEADLAGFEERVRALDEMPAVDRRQGPPFTEVERDLFALTATDGGGIGVWGCSPWDDVRPLDLAGDAPPGIEAVLPQGDREPAAVALRNGGLEPVSVRPSCDAPWVSVYEARYVEKPDHRYMADALVPVDEIALPAGMTKLLWVMADGRGLAPGRHETRLDLLMVNGGGAVMEKREVPVVARVIEAAYPDQLTLSGITWCYVDVWPTIKHVAGYAIADNIKHHADTFVMHPNTVPWPEADGSIDFSAFDARMKRYAGAREVAWFWGFSEGRVGQGRFGPAFSEEWHRRFGAWYQAWIAHLLELGYGYDEFFFYPFDETLCEDFRKVAKAMKEADPKARIWADPVRHSTREEIEAMLPYIDVWAPNLGSFRDRPADMALMRGDAESYWVYQCSGPAQSMDPGGYYRMTAWFAWKHGMSAGIGIWAYGDTGWSEASMSSAWSPFDAARADYALIYETEGKPYSSRRWEAFREGIEDYELLRMAVEAGMAKTEAETLVDEVLAECGEDRRVYDRVRGRLLGALEK